MPEYWAQPYCWFWLDFFLDLVMSIYVKDGFIISLSVLVLLFLAVLLALKDYFFNGPTHLFFYSILLMGLN